MPARPASVARRENWAERRPSWEASQRTAARTVAGDLPTHTVGEKPVTDPKSESAVSDA